MPLFFPLASWRFLFCYQLNLFLIESFLLLPLAPLVFDSRLL